MKDEKMKRWNEEKLFEWIESIKFHQPRKQYMYKYAPYCNYSPISSNISNEVLYYLISEIQKLNEARYIIIIIIEEKDKAYLISTIPDR